MIKQIQTTPIKYKYKKIINNLYYSQKIDCNWYIILTNVISFILFFKILSDFNKFSYLHK